jgi:predicted Zn-dependent protease
MIFVARLRAGLFCVALTFCSPLIYAQSSGGGQSAEQYAQEGQAALAAGRMDIAERDFEKLRDAAPGIAEVHATLGRIYFEERKFDVAVRELQTALKQKPTLPKVRTLLAVSLSEAIEYQAAIPGLEQCFHRSTDPAEKQMCGLQLERAYTGLNMNPKAVEVALEMDKLYPTDAEVLYHSSQIYGNMAYQTIHQMNVVAPNSPWRYLTIAEASESQGAYTAAVDQYRQVLLFDPHHPGVHYRIGRTLLAQSRRSGSDQDQSGALKEFLDELEIDPANANAAYEAAEIYRDSGDVAQAQKYFQSAIDLYPEFEDAHIGLATVFIGQKQPQSAITELHKAIALNSGNEVSWYRLSQAARAVGDSDEQHKAIAEFRRLHQEQLNQAAAGKSAPPAEITKQKIDPPTAP